MPTILSAVGDIIKGMDLESLPGEVCEHCRHTLRAGACPSCGWAPEAGAGDHNRHDPRDDVSGIRGW